MQKELQGYHKAPFLTQLTNTNLKKIVYPARLLAILLVAALPQVLPVNIILYSIEEANKINAKELGFPWLSHKQGALFTASLFATLSEFISYASFKTLIGGLVYTCGGLSFCDCWIGNYHVPKYIVGEEKDIMDIRINLADYKGADMELEEEEDGETVHKLGSSLNYQTELILGCRRFLMQREGHSHQILYWMHYLLNNAVSVLGTAYLFAFCAESIVTDTLDLTVSETAYYLTLAVVATLPTIAYTGIQWTVSAALGWLEQCKLKTCCPEPFNPEAAKSKPGPIDFPLVLANAPAVWGSCAPLFFTPLPSASTEGAAEIRTPLLSPQDDFMDAIGASTDDQIKEKLRVKELTKQPLISAQASKEEQMKEEQRMQRLLALSSASPSIQARVRS